MIEQYCTNNKTNHNNKAKFASASNIRGWTYYIRFKQPVNFFSDHRKFIVIKNHLSIILLTFTRCAIIRIWAFPVWDGMQAASNWISKSLSNFPRHLRKRRMEISKQYDSFIYLSSFYNNGSASIRVFQTKLST